MKKKYFCVLFIMLFISAYVFADPVVKYEIIDIGVLIADESEAIAINDKGQVLGKLNHGGKWDVFLWDKDSGLQVLDLPDCHDLHLNNHGQIAGNHSNGIFIWDKVTGFYNVGTFDGKSSIQGFNDKGQILIMSWTESSPTSTYQIFSLIDGQTSSTCPKLGVTPLDAVAFVGTSSSLAPVTGFLQGSCVSTISPFGVILGSLAPSEAASISSGAPTQKVINIYLWDHGITKDISKDFLMQFPDYSIAQAADLNNNEEVVLIGTDSQNNSIEKSFIWSESGVIELFKEYGRDVCVHVWKLDDHGNMLVSISSHSQGSYDYFINPSQVFQAIIDTVVLGISTIRNSQPQPVSCLASKLKKKFDGAHYYTWSTLFPALERVVIPKP